MRSDGSQLEGGARGARQWAAGTEFGHGGTGIGDDQAGLDHGNGDGRGGRVAENGPRAGPPSLSQKGS